MTLEECIESISNKECVYRVSEDNITQLLPVAIKKDEFDATRNVVCSCSWYKVIYSPKVLFKSKKEAIEKLIEIKMNDIKEIEEEIKELRSIQ